METEGRTNRPTKMDMHAHSWASDGPATAALGMVGCPECYSPPERVFDQAIARGMDLVTITDHDTIKGALELHERGFERFVIGEEVTVYFPEDRCKLHVLVWGLSPGQHEDMLPLRDDVYAFAHWLRGENLAHSLAHPLYVQNGRLSRWHIERCVLLFKCFETLNGAHSWALAEAIDRYLSTLKPSVVQRLTEVHGMEPLWPRVWEKGRTGGSDDHGLLNVGRTWTGVTDEGGLITDPRQFLRHVMGGRCEPAGVAGHPSLLAHQLATVGAHFANSKLEGRLGPRGQMVAAKLLKFAGVRAKKPGKVALAWDALKGKLLRRRRLPVLGALKREIGPALARHPAIRARLDPGMWTDGCALSLHEEMGAFAEDLSSVVGRSMSPAAVGALRSGDLPRALDYAASYGVLLAAQLPYIVSLFHQNKEREFLEKFEHETGAPGRSPLERPMRVSLFTDTLGDINGVSRFIRNVAAEATATGRDLRVVTSTKFECPNAENIVNFEPVIAGRIPKYENLEIVVPPVLRILREIDGHRPDAIHISTPGPVGLVGFLAARMLRIPVLGVYHTDFPAYVDHLFDDHSLTWLTAKFMRGFYGPFAAVFTRSREYASSVERMGVRAERIVPLLPGVDTELFNVRHADASVWSKLDGLSSGGPGPVRVLYVGRVSVEKNMPLLTRVWRGVREKCNAAGLDASLVIVGDGPYRPTMEQAIGGTGVKFLGFRHGDELSAIYASSDLFVFPSTTDTLGQVVMEAQASGLPVIVSDEGGPKEVVAEGHTGFVLSADEPGGWVDAIVGMVADADKRRRMGASAHGFMQGYTMRASFDHFWSVHERIWHAHLAGKGITPARRAEEPEALAQAD